MRRCVRCAIILLLGWALQPGTAVADLRLGIPVYATQPDGQRLELRSSGDEFYQTTETVDGFTVVRDPESKWVCYAKLSDDGAELVSTGVRVGTAAPRTLGLTPHLRISREAREAKVMAVRERFSAGLWDRWQQLGKPVRPAATGDFVGITILIDFSDDPATLPVAEVDAFCNQVGYTGFGNNGSVYDYFFDVSDGLLHYANIVPSVYYRAVHPKSWYEDTSVPIPERAQGLVLEALNDLEANGFDFSACDANNDGVIDAINIFYAGVCNTAWSTGLWPHSFVVSFAADGVRSARYQISDMGDALQLVTFCHENGHQVCDFPDLYDHTFESYGVGTFCLMCYSPSDTNPVEICAPLKRYADWTIDHELIDSQYGLSATAGVNAIYYYPNPHRFPVKEYYIIENRHGSGRDEAMRDQGLAIWHVDEEGSNNWNDMLPTRHYEVTLVQADGRWDFENGANWGDSRDLWKAPDYTECTPLTSPPTTWWNEWSGNLTGLAITNISEEGPVMSFDYLAYDWSSDCNQNGIEDSLDIGNGTSEDIDGNGVPDECEFIIGRIQYYDPDTGVADSPFDSQTISLKAVVSAEKGTVANDGMYVQDGSGGVKYFAPYAEGAALGDTLAITAFVMTYPFTGEIILLDEDSPPNFTVVGRGPEPAPRPFALPDLVASYENVGWFVETEGTVVYIHDTGFFLSLDGSLLRVRIWESTGIDISGLQDGSVMKVRGVYVRSEGQTQLWPRGQSDLVIPRTADPVIVGVEDVAEDQGRHVNLAWRGSIYDQPASDTPILVYSLHRRDAPDTWSFVTSLSATGDEQYAVTVPTLGDSTILHGQHYTTFKIRASTADPAVFFESAPDSGYSVDNLAPAGVTSLTASYAYWGVFLDWTDAPEPDFLSYRVYRGDDAEFEPSPETLVEETYASAWSEIRSEPWGAHYKITAMDAAGNESEPRAPTPPIAGTGQETPAATVLLGAAPNPFNPSTTLSFVLATGGRATLEIYDVAGRRVATLVDEYRGAGIHDVAWDGRDASRRQLASGVYFYRFTSGDYRATRRVTLVK